MVFSGGREAMLLSPGAGFYLTMKSADVIFGA